MPTAGRSVRRCGPAIPPMSPSWLRSPTVCAADFGIGRVCVIADRGMISSPTIAALEERGLEYVLGPPPRTGARGAGGARRREETQLLSRRPPPRGAATPCCRKEAETGRDTADHRAVIEAFDRQLKSKY